MGASVHDTPARPKQDKRSKVVKQRAVLDEYAQYGSIAGAAKEAGVPFNTVKTWLERDEEFKQNLADTRELFLNRLESEAVRRAVEGVTEGVYYQGDRVDSLQKYSDGLLTFLLKANDPEKYRETKMSIEIVTVDAIDKEIMRLRGLMQEKPA